MLAGTILPVHIICRCMKLGISGTRTGVGRGVKHADEGSSDNARMVPSLHEFQFFESFTLDKPLDYAVKVRVLGWDTIFLRLIL